MSTSGSGRLATARSRLSSALETSRLVGAARSVEATLARWGRNSRVVRWFLSEPDPAVVVVDLRQTYTVGPVLRLLTRTAGLASGLAERTGVTGARSSVVDRVRSAPVRALGAVVAAVALVGVATALLAGGPTGGWLVLLGGALLATRERRSAGELTESRVGRVIVAALEPPDPHRRDGG